MPLLRKMYFGFMPLFWHALGLDSAHHVTLQFFHRRRFRIRYPRLIRGIIFLIILLIILFALPLSASTQPYLSAGDIPSYPPTSVAVDPGWTGQHPGDLQPPVLLPVTGN